MTTLGERLRLARDKSGLKQTQVKDRTNINNKTLSGYENNVSEPDTATLTTLAELYEVSFRWLLSGKGEMVDGRTINKTSNLGPAPTELTQKDELDMAKRMEKMKRDLIEGNAEGGDLNYKGEPMSEEAIESLLEALEHAERITTLASKKYIPKKYRD